MQEEALKGLNCLVAALVLLLDGGPLLLSLSLLLFNELDGLLHLGVLDALLLSDFANVLLEVLQKHAELHAALRVLKRLDLRRFKLKRRLQLVDLLVLRGDGLFLLFQTLL